MPKRSNEFQKLVFLIQQQFASDAIVTESKELIDLITGKEREVDICIEAQIGGHSIIISFECIDHKRKADVTWVEKMKSKHDRLPTNKLVLVSRSGFSSEAQKITKAYGIEILIFEDIDEKSIANIFGKTNSLWQKVWSLSINKEKVLVRVKTTSDLASENVLGFSDLAIYMADGRLFCDLKSLVLRFLYSEEFAKDFGSNVNETHKYFYTRFNQPADNKGNPLYLLKEDPKVLREIDYIHIEGECNVKMSEFPVRKATLGNLQVAWGNGKFLGKEAFLLLSENEVGERKLLINSEDVSFTSLSIQKKENNIDDTTQ